MALTNRERFVRVFNGQPVDKVPFLDLFEIWPSTLERWKREGLQADATQETVRGIIGFDGARGIRLPVKGFIWPEFECEEVSREGGLILRRNQWGAVERNLEDAETMWVTHEGPVSGRDDWPDIKRRLDPATPGRFPADWADICARAAASPETVYVGDLPIGFFGAPRELFGLDRLLLVYYDDPSLMHEILDTLCELWIDVYVRVLKDVKLDWFMIWEDMCFKNGPLIGPDTFREFLLPRYKRLTSALRENGCAHILVDSDGDQRALAPLWIEGGVDIVFPWETQFGLELLDVRRSFPSMGIMGGLDKAALARGREAMDRELEKIPPLLERGRFIPGLDHGVAPDTSWDDYRYFHEKLRDIIAEYGG